MNAKELRIGNLFIEKHSKQIIPVLELLRNGNIVFDAEFEGKWQAEPIPLSEDILIKLGFEINEDNFYGWLGIKLNENMSLVCMYGFQGISLATSAIHEEFEHIQYVHQLQNLYFSLTGKHLPLK